MLIVGQKIIFNRIWRINAKSHPFTHAFLGVRFKVVGRALAWHARGHRFDPGNLEVLFILSASKGITILQILCKIRVEVRRNVQDAALIIRTFAGKYLEPIKHNMHKITEIHQNQFPET